MNDQKWEALKQRIKSKFGNIEVSAEDVVLENSPDLKIAGTRDILEFTSGNTRFRITRENKPLVLGKHMHYSHRQGDSARTEYVFSDTELSHKIFFYKEDELGEWQPLRPEDADILS